VLLFSLELCADSSCAAAPPPPAAQRRAIRDEKLRAKDAATDAKRAALKRARQVHHKRSRNYMLSHVLFGVVTLSTDVLSSSFFPAGNGKYTNIQYTESVYIRRRMLRCLLASQRAAQSAREQLTWSFYRDVAKGNFRARSRERGV
jgi:hypothetical protein